MPSVAVPEVPPSVTDCASAKPPVIETA